jgi:probable F420-dependent oxidoreductase
VKFWQSLAFMEPDQLTEIAPVVEEVGFHGVLLSDHLFHPDTIEPAYPYSPDGKAPFTPDTPFPEPWCTICAMAAVTRRLYFCTNIFILPLRNPLEVAKAVSTAAVLSDNRVVVGAGVGWAKEEFDPVAQDFHTRGRRFDEMVEVMRKLWQGGMVEHQGEYYAFDRLQMTPAPSRPVPIYIGGHSGPALRRAARLGDGWIGAGYAPEEVSGFMGRLKELRKQAGRGHLPFEFVVPVSVPPDVDLFRRLEDEGVTSLVSYLYPRTPLDARPKAAGPGAVRRERDSEDALVPPRGRAPSRPRSVSFTPGGAGCARP